MRFDRLVGVYHFLSDRAPQDVPVAPPRPRRPNPYRSNGKVLVSRMSATADLKASIEAALAKLGGLDKVIGRNDKVLVKPNFNSPDPYPASTDPEFLHAAVKILLEAGARVTIGESAGGVWRPTVNVFRKLKLYELAAGLGVKLVAFEEEPKEWVRINIPGNYLKSVTVPRVAYEADRLVYLPCMKTHRLARFSGALKLNFGLVHPGERRAFHAGHLEQKLGEANLWGLPDLVIMDGRKSFVTGGPSRGRVVEPGLILASADPVAVDMEAVKVLMAYRASNRLLAPELVPHIRTARERGLGPGPEGYEVVEA